jgi:SHOCT-like domain
MATSEERMKILKMIEEHKISPEEGARLLSALAKAERKRTAAVQGEGRWLRVRVTDVDSGKTAVNVNLPISLVNVGLRMGARFVPEMEGVSMSELEESIRQGVTGKIIDIVDEEEGQRVEVYVE